MAQVFLSYARGDVGKARPLAAALEKAGHSVWWDGHVRGGTQFSKEIEEALALAEAVVVLWSKESVESPWVRDEAAVGRDSDRLVPLSLDGTAPPLGFRQFHTISLKGWTGRGKIPSLADVLSGVDNRTGSTAPALDVRESSARPQAVATRPRWLRGAAVALALLIVAAIGWWKLNALDVPVVEVLPADPSPQSSAAANLLFVKLGSLAQIGDGRWQLIDGSSASGKPDLLLRTSDSSTPGRPSANLVLLDGRSNGLLWSHEFNLPAGSDADLRQQMALSAGRVLGCALESRDQGHLSADLRKTYLDACASLADIGGEDSGPVTAQLRTIVERSPKFEPAWNLLIGSEASAIDQSRSTPAFAQKSRQLRLDAAKARSNYPNLPELAVADVHLRDQMDYGKNIEELSAAVERAPTNPLLHSELASAYLMVGRMRDAIESARTSAALDPLSPGGTSTLIMTLAHGGEIETARGELKKAEDLWSGTGSLRDAQLAFHVRYGDPAAAMALDPTGYNTAIYYQTRADPSAQNIARLKAGIDEFRTKSVTPDKVGWATQSLAEFGLVDDVFYWIERLSADQMAHISYVLFRPTFASVRRDPRFMPLARRVGLVDYWQKTGRWPDFCDRPGISYDCKTAAQTGRTAN